MTGLGWKEKEREYVAGCYRKLIAGWRSLAARWPHKPQAGGSNPPPVTEENTMTWIDTDPVDLMPGYASGRQVDCRFTERDSISLPGAKEE